MASERKAPSGILGFPVSPFDQNGHLDEKALEANIEFLIENGLSSIFVACGAGEYHALSKGEYQTAVEVAVSVAKGRVPVYTGVGGNISQALEALQISEDAGAEGYLILPPYLILPEQLGLYNYCKSIVESSDLNAILYQRDNAVFQAETLKRLLDNYPQIVGVKDGLGDMELNMELLETIGDRVEWLNGMPLAEITMKAYHNIGYNSYSSAISNYIPHISRMYYDAIQNNQHDLAREIYVNVLLPINRIRKARKGYAVALIKAGMEIVGLPVINTIRPPVVPVEKAHYEELKGIIKFALAKYPKPTKASKL
jgi:5-dehydro-4-deoxyglucarate dehydratase